MRLPNKKAVSTLTLIMLMLCAAVLGGILSYMFVIANFYLEPENTVDLVITEVYFPVDHADYFEVTIMNPSHSPSGANITEIYFTVDGEEALHNVTETDLGELPIFLERGTSETIRCFENWGQFAGKTIKVHVSAMDVSGAVRSAKTEYVKFDMDANFDATISCKRFNLVIRNYPQSKINLTLTKVSVNRETQENIVLLPDYENVTFPMSLPWSESFSFQCLYDWENLVDPLVRVETLEGYYVEKKANATASVLLLITDVDFDETNSTKMSITVLNSAQSTTQVDITNIALAYDNKTEFIDGSLADPHLPYSGLKINETVTFNCIWDWSDQSYRDIDITVTVYTKQEFVSQSKIVRTQPYAVWKITNVEFNLNDTESFLIDIANMPSSLQKINVTQIKFNETITEITPSFWEIPVGKEKQFSCAFNWTGFRGSVNVTVSTADGLSTSKSITLPTIDLKISDIITFAKSTATILHVNVTVLNTVFSTENVTITQIIFETGNTTDVIDGTLANPKLVPDGYVLIVAANVTIVCPWNWTLYPNQYLTITVQTAEGFSLSQTFKIPKLVEP